MWVPPEQEVGAARSATSAPRGGRCPPAVRPVSAGTGAGSTLVSALIPWRQLEALAGTGLVHARCAWHSRMHTAERSVCSGSVRAGETVPEEAVVWVWGLLDSRLRGHVCVCQVMGQVSGRPSQALGIGRAW